MTHEKLIERAVYWLRKSMKCECVLTEPCMSISKEIPDAIGWYLGKSIVVECKVGLDDFYSDRQKPSRRTGKGLGRLRYYLTPPGLLKNATLPAFWGVLECYPRQIRKAKVAREARNDYVDSISECAILARCGPERRSDSHITCDELVYLW